MIKKVLVIFLIMIVFTAILVVALWVGIKARERDLKQQEIVPFTTPSPALISPVSEEEL